MMYMSLLRATGRMFLTFLLAVNISILFSFLKDIFASDRVWFQHFKNILAPFISVLSLVNPIIVPCNALFSLAISR